MVDTEQTMPSGAAPAQLLDSRLFFFLSLLVGVIAMVSLPRLLSTNGLNLLSNPAELQMLTMAVGGAAMLACFFCRIQLRENKSPIRRDPCRQYLLSRVPVHIDIF